MKKCLCGCGETVKYKFVHGHNLRVFSKEVINKKLKSLEKVWADKEFKEKRKKQMKKLWKDPDYIKKQKEGLNRPEVKIHLCKIAKERMQDSTIKNKMITTMKKKFSDPEFRKMISERTKQGLKEKGYTSEVISKLTKEGMKGLDLSGPNSASWRGGLSYQGYCPVWNDKELKEYIFERDNNECKNPECWKKSKRLVRHHIDYDKMNCNPANIILVCNSCNGRANKNRHYWKGVYQKITEQRSLDE